MASPTSVRPRAAARSSLAAALGGALLVSLLGAGPVREAAAQQPAGGGTVSREVYQGWKWFHVYCYRCHGTDAIGNPGLPGPDLRASVKNLAKPNFSSTVKEGRLPKGMPAWGQLLTETQVEELYAYVTARSEGTLRAGRPDEQ